MSVFTARRRELIMKEANRTGYFQFPTTTVILQETGVPTVNDVHLVQLASRRFRSVGDVALCQAITVCDLSNNYLTAFDALQSCTQLVYLDLHKNQIDRIPETKFWSMLRHLQVLYLHGNAFNYISSVESMSSSEKLSILTLYDSPVSLQPNYRHHVVNSIWSLKALDHFVIADEEIIEEADFGGRFAAMTKHFKTDLYQPIPVKCSAKDANQLVRQLVSKVNTLYGHNSPVITIQKWTRGWLERCHISSILEKRSMAASKIQFAYRQYKGIEIPVADQEGVPSCAISPAPAACPSSPTPDYKQYIFSRPVSCSSVYAHSLRSFSSPEQGPRVEKSAHVSLQRLERNVTEKARLDEEDMAGLKYKLPKYSLLKVPLTIRNKCHLRTNCLGGGPQDELLAMAEKKLSIAVGRKTQPRLKAKSLPPRWYPHVRTLGLLNTCHRFPCSKSESDVDLNLTGRLPSLQTKEPIEEVVMSRRQAGQDVQTAARASDHFRSTIPKPKITKTEPDANDHILMARIQTMTLACLSAVDKAYEKRKKIQEKELKVQKVKKRHHGHSASKQRNEKRYRQKREAIAAQRVLDKKQLTHLKQQLDTKKKRTREDVRMKRSNEQQQEKAYQDEASFVQEFHQQQLSVSQALIKHDIQTAKEDQLRAAQAHVLESRKQTREQQNLIKTYLEHRHLLAAHTSANERAHLNAHMVNEANHSLMKAKRRVARLRAKETVVNKELIKPVLPSQEDTGNRPQDNIYYLDMSEARKKKGNRSRVQLNPPKYRGDSGLTASL